MKNLSQSTFVHRNYYEFFPFFFLFLCANPFSFRIYLLYACACSMCSDALALLIAHDCYSNLFVKNVNAQRFFCTLLHQQIISLSTLRETGIRRQRASHKILSLSILPPTYYYHASETMCLRGDICGVHVFGIPPFLWISEFSFHFVGEIAMKMQHTATDDSGL